MIRPEPCIAVSHNTIMELLRKDERVGKEKYWQQLIGMRQARLLMVVTTSLGLKA